MKITLKERKKFAELGRKGGKATAKKYGSAYMRELGIRGRKKRYEKEDNKLKEK